MFYFLMHENNKVAFFEVDDTNSIVLRLKVNMDNAHLLPAFVYNEVYLKDWINKRGIPVTRQHINIDLKMSNVSSTFELMLRNYGLSLTDHYWIKPADSYYSWETINLYTNYFTSAYSLDLRDDLPTIAGKTNFVPSASLKGDLKKKWIIDNNGIRRLVKGNYNNTCRQSISEVLATEVHKKQGLVQYTPYGLIKISSDNQEIIGCECPNFTDINTEFISAYDIVDSYEQCVSKKPNDVSYYEFYIWICNQQGLDIRGFMEYQILTDFIISNTDRHFNNFGIIRNSQNLQWLMPAPIFDSGNSMFYKANYVPVDKALLKLEVTSFLKSEVQHLRYITNRGLIDLRLLPDDNYLYNLLKVDNNTKDETNERLVKAYNKKIKYLSDFQNGANIWSYTYKG